MPRPVLAETRTASDVSRPITSSISLQHALGLGRRQVDLVQDRDDLVIGVDRLIDVGQRLRLDALAGIDHQQRALAGGQRAADLVGEVDMARRVHQVQHVGLAVLRRVVEPHGLRLDGDAALALDVHRIEHLVVELALGHRAAAHQQPVGQGALAMVDMGDDREIADQRQVGHFNSLDRERQLAHDWRAGRSRPDDMVHSNPQHGAGRLDDLRHDLGAHRLDLRIGQVRSTGCRVTVMASDFLPSAHALAGIDVEHARARDQRLVGVARGAHAASRPRRSSSTTKAKSRSTGWKGESMSCGRALVALALGSGGASRKTSKAATGPLRSAAVERSRGCSSPKCASTRSPSLSAPERPG